MYYKEYFPEPFFSRYIDSYFTIDTSLVQEDITDLVVPDGTFGILFIDSQHSIKRNTSLQAPPVTLKKSSVFGQKTKPVNYYYSPGTTESFGIKVNPEGMPLFLNENQKELKNLRVEFDGLEDPELKELEEKVLEQPSVAGKIKAVEDFVVQRVARLNSDENYLLFTAIVEYIKAKKGEVRFNQLTRHFNLHYKKIERLFQHYLGVTPKTYIRIIRFNATIYLHKCSNNLNFTQLGNEAGFFDQSHFIREFKTFSNLTPKDFFRREFSSSEQGMIEIITKRWTE